MKIRIDFILITALCLAAFVLGACGYLDGADSQGSITITFENSGARYTVKDGDKTTMIYTITLTSPGKNTVTKTTGKGDTSVSIPVPEGDWTIQVKAEGDRVIGEGDAKVTVKAGKPASATVKMAVTGTRVSSWAELMQDFKDTSLANHSIEIVEDLAVPSSAQSQGGTGAIELTTSKTITLWAKKPVKITRIAATTTVNVTVFTITNGTLILDGSKGTITLDGVKDKVPLCDRALINVTDNGVLKINDGVTLTNNTTGYGGGVYVSGNNAYFYMSGGLISNNTATKTGGGVCIYESKGHFIKTGGVIYGYIEGDNNSNKALGETKSDTGQSGSAVYYSSIKYKDSTLGLNDNLTYP